MNFPLKKVHFIGIGGIGMSAIAEMLPTFGVTVQGSNNVENANTMRLQKMGISVFIGHDENHLKGVEAVVVSSAIHPDNVELLEAQRLGIPVAHRSEMLAELMRFKKSISISGSHGKTTTSSLIAHMLVSSNMDPSFIIGGILNAKGSNAGAGSGEWIVAEADESDGSFLKLPSTISVVTNIEPEHMDYYKTFDREKMAYQTFLNQTAFYGVCVVCVDHPVVREILPEIKNRKVMTYGFSKTADVHADNVRVVQGGSVFDVYVRQVEGFEKISDVAISLMGKHNILNALAAFSVGEFLKLDREIIKKSLADFMGIQRRLTLRGTEQEVAVYDDYAHHPTEIKATLSALKEHVSGRLVAVFQPHRYTRFQDLWTDFKTAFEGVDALFVTDVYSAGDPVIEGVMADKFVAEMLPSYKHIYKTSETNFARDVAHFVQSGDTVVCLNAGSLSRHIPELLEALKK
ncbi:MAG: UDP-N-acetylmuramate--L-alanine ligase [Alphaproteobacteria bacterium]|nr:UDP-N-acetylmuramate--L-alanine ligase [Alphaproteobacteria bacterium]